MVGKHKAHSGKPQKREVDAVKHNSTTYKPGMCVLINPDAAAPAYIARIKRLWQQSGDPDDVQLELTWFYRPEEAVGGRKKFHGEQEVFESEHVDHAHKNSILGPCSVHTIKAFESLPARTNSDFYTRFKYKPQTKEFEPDSVPVYCICELPYNPDNPMVMCSHCSEWYHPECLKLPTSVLTDESFNLVCKECESREAEQPRKKAGTHRG